MDPSIRPVRPEDIYTHSHMLEHDVEWWVERVKWYNILHETAISEQMVRDLFSLPEAVLHGHEETKHQMYVVYKFWQEHGGLEGLVCSS